MASITGLKKSSKFLLKEICHQARLTQVTWVEQHLVEDQQKMDENQEKSVQGGR